MPKPNIQLTTERPKITPDPAKLHAFLNDGESQEAAPIQVSTEKSTVQGFKMKKFPVDIDPELDAALEQAWRKSNLKTRKEFIIAAIWEKIRRSDS